MDSITIRTSIRPGLKRFLLIRGTLLALIGVALLIYSGVFISVETLTNWGAAIVLVSFLLMAWGLVPYKRITKMEENPNKLVITEDEHLHYHRHGKDILTFPLKAIKDVKFIGEKSLYGIALELEPDWKEKVPDPALSVVMQMFLYSMKKRHQFDRFFPYFSERGAEEVKELVHLDADNRR